MLLLSVAPEILHYIIAIPLDIYLLTKFSDAVGTIFIALCVMGALYILYENGYFDSKKDS
jgi:hypothetical protein